METANSPETLVSNYPATRCHIITTDIRTWNDLPSFSFEFTPNYRMGRGNKKFTSQEVKSSPDRIKPESPDCESDAMATTGKTLSCPKFESIISSPFSARIK
jgi:hypothetical protein